MTTTAKYRTPTKSDTGRTLSFVRIAKETGEPCEEMLGDGLYFGKDESRRPGFYRTSIGCFNTRFVLVIA